MPDPLAIKYRAFLSYSHKDTGWARWLHAKLEALRIDKDLVGRETTTGSIPKTLRPIFRDREDFTAGHTLSEQTLAALDASAALIVLCSPAAAKSRYVNEEIALFKSRHPGRPVIPVIVDGTPGDPAKECFAPSLKFKLGPQGQIGSVADETLAADVREEGDGRNLAVAKTVARLLGLQTDDVFRRAERERRRQTRMWSTIGVVIAGLTAAGGFLAWQSHERQKTIAEVEAVIAKYSMADSAEATVPGAKESLGKAIVAIAEGAASDARYAKALQLIKLGKPREAEPLLKAVAEDTEAQVVERAARGRKQAAAAYKNLGTITRLSDPKGARYAFEKASGLDPSDAEAVYWNGRTQFLVGNFDAAESAFKLVRSLERTDANAADIWWALTDLARLAYNRGEFDMVLKLTHEAQAEATRLSKAQPGNDEWKFALAATEELFGLVLEAQDRPAESLDAYRRGETITRNVAQTKPNDRRAQRSWAASLMNVGKGLAALDQTTEALASFKGSVDIMRRYLAANPTYVAEKYFLVSALESFAAMLLKEGNVEGAKRELNDGLTFLEEMSHVDSENPVWQAYSLKLSFIMGQLLAEHGETANALEIYRKCIAMGDQLSKTQTQRQGPDQSWQTHADVCTIKAADILVAMSKSEEALELLAARLKIVTERSAQNPEKFESLTDIAFIHDKIGETYLAMGSQQDALTNFEKASGIRNQSAQQPGRNAEQQNELAVADSKVGDLLLTKQDYINAQRWYERAADKGNADAMTNLGVLYNNGQGVAQDYSKAREWYEKAAAKDEPNAMRNLGILYTNGRGVSQDYVKARDWYEKAGAKGDADAMFNLGVLYDNGQGVAQDYAKASEWYEKAAAKNMALAMTNLGVLYDNGQGVAQDHTKARELYEKAAGRDEPNAMRNLGALHANGQGIDRDFAKARFWYEKAAAKGDEVAATNLERLPIDEAMASGRYDQALALQEALTKRIEESETKSDGKPGAKTAVQLNGESWYALFARDFAKALAAADRAYGLNPEIIMPLGNKAHALMFLERGDEARALYRAHAGKPLSPDDSKPWERAVADDFAEFRKAGLTHPMMEEVEKELGVAP